ncbi:MAG: protein tyrosine phosphatase [Alphaproteobacteria bacterium]|nr:protein tyrosine phosphatase [Alphaproteobacteria bacterium]
MAIIVCPLSKVTSVAAARRPQRVVSLLDPHSAFPNLPDYVDRHHKAPVHDITDYIDGLKAPCETSVGEVIRFVSDWDRSAPILIHCYAGISRSTATAFVTACLHNPKADEEEIALALRAASATASPNMLIVEIADAELGRRGRMVRAIERIGRGYPSWEVIGEAQPFEIPAYFAAKDAA